MGVAGHLQLTAGARFTVLRVQAECFAHECQRRDGVQQRPGFFRANVDGVVAGRRRLAKQHLWMRDSGRLQPRVASLVETAVDAPRDGLAAGAPLRRQVRRLVGLVPDRVERYLRAVVPRDGGHEFLEIERVGPVGVGGFVVRGGPARRRRGHGQEHLPAQPLGFSEQHVVLAPVVVAGVGRFEAWLRRAGGCGRDFIPAELHAQRFHAERLQLRERRGTGYWVQQIGRALEVELLIGRGLRLAGADRAGG